MSNKQKENEEVFQEFTKDLFCESFLQGATAFKDSFSKIIQGLNVETISKTDILNLLNEISKLMTEENVKNYYLKKD